MISKMHVLPTALPLVGVLEGYFQLQTIRLELNSTFAAQEKSLSSLSFSWM